MLILLDPARRPVIGHRGNRAHAPENTLESFGQAVALGVDAIEFDVHLSADGVPVVIHDPTLERTTNGRGRVADHTLDQLRALDAGYQFSRDGGRSFPYRAGGIQIPTLDEVLATHAALPLILELKVASAALPVLSALERARSLERVVVGSFVPEALAQLAGRGLARSPAAPELTRLYLPAALGLNAALPPFEALCIPRFHRGIPLPIGGYTRLMRGAGRPVHIWTVNDPRLARRLWDGGVSGIISDDPALMLAERRGPA